MGNPLRDRRTPQALAEMGQVIEISEKICDFERLARIVEADLGTLDTAKLPPRWRDAEVTGELRFGFLDARGSLPVASGFADVVIDAVCQRCLEPFALPVATDIRVVFAEGGPAPAADDDYEVWEMENPWIRPLELVEELLIMALPYAPKHAAGGDCAALAGTNAAAGTNNPFAGLRERLKGDPATE